MNPAKPASPSRLVLTIVVLLIAVALIIGLCWVVVGPSVLGVSATQAAAATAAALATP